MGHFPTSKLIHVVVVNPFQNKELSSHILERHFFEACQTFSGSITQKEGISFKVRSLCQNSINGLALISFLSSFVFWLLFRWIMLGTSRMLRRFYREQLMNIGYLS